MLELKNVETAYGQSQVLFGVDLQVNDGEVVTLLGRNGMGKTTTIHSIMGGLIEESPHDSIHTSVHVHVPVALPVEDTV